jgi:tRNA(Ile)-lysidine synthase TilS/MesJ
MTSSLCCPKSIIDPIIACLNHFRVSIPDRIAVGLSGGKDSTTLMLALRDLGVFVVPIIVDMGYESFAASAIAHGSADLGFSPVVISARDSVSSLPTPEGRELSQNLDALGSDSLETPCGHCSRSKRLLLIHEASRMQLAAFCLAHHREDLVTTLLKDFFVLRYHQQYGAFDRDRFRNFVTAEAIDLAALRQLVLSARASTMAVTLRESNSVSLLRPLAFVPEGKIEAFVASKRLPVFGSGCSHSIFQGVAGLKATKREIVHSDLRRRLASEPTLGSELLELALLALDPAGRPWANPRSERSRMLPGFENENRKAGGGGTWRGHGA